jgi:hypothetical protein
MVNDSAKALDDNDGGSQKKKVAIHLIEVCKAMDPLEWPSGEFLEKYISELFAASATSSASASKSSYCSPNPEGVNFNMCAKYWQAAARHALMEKYGHSVHTENSSSIQLNEIELVQKRWEELVREVFCSKPSVKSSEAVANTSDSDEIDILKNYTAEQAEGGNRIEESNGSASSIRIDIIDFIKNQCCISNNRQMEWSLMLCPPGVQFQLHAHPNIELIYCLRGALYEVRMDGLPISRCFEKSDGADGGDEAKAKVAGPELTYIQRSWSFGTLKASQWLVNEVGSIHKSFTSSKADGGCDLLVLWGGSHANILEPPISPNVQKAVDSMNKRLTEDCSAENNNAYCCSETGNIISATFLPDSEKSGIV